MNDKHKLFADEYLANGLNATHAYMKVYPKVKKEDTAAVNGSKLLRNTKVQEYIAEQQNKTAEKLEIKREDVVKDILDIITNNKEQSPSVALKGLEMINKMFGFDAPQKTETKISGDINISKLFGFDEE